MMHNLEACKKRQPLEPASPCRAACRTDECGRGWRGKTKEAGKKRRREGDRVIGDGSME